MGNTPTPGLIPFARYFVETCLPLINTTFYLTKHSDSLYDHLLNLGTAHFLEIPIQRSTSLVAIHTRQ